MHKDREKVTLVCKFSIYPTEDEVDDPFDRCIKIDVYNGNGKYFWAPFYYHNSAYAEIIEQINKKILEKLKQIKAKRKRSKK